MSTKLNPKNSPHPSQKIFILTGLEKMVDLIKGRFITESYYWLIYEFEINFFLFKKKIYIAIDYKYKSFPKCSTKLSELATHIV